MTLTTLTTLTAPRFTWSLTALLALAVAAPVFAQSGSVTLYQRTDREGFSMSFASDVPDLAATRFGAFHANSADIDRGCEATLYERPGFRGSSIVLREADNNLGNTQIGRNSVGSLRIRCRDDRGGRPPDLLDPPRHRPEGAVRGVTLYSQHDLRGEGQTFRYDVPDLRRTAFGENRASSLDVSRGCVATLFQLPDYRGRATTFREADNDLSNTAVGDNNVSSLRVTCPGDSNWGRPDDDDGGGPWSGRPRREMKGVTLYSRRDLRGEAQKFRYDVPDLRKTEFGENRASSIDVTRGCLVTLFELPNYRGRATTFREADNNLSNTAVGDNNVSSIRVRCQGDSNWGRPDDDDGLGPWGGRAPQGSTRGVTIFRDRNLKGPSETFSGDVADLSRTRIGAGTASSIEVPRGCVATLFALPNFGGRSTTFNDTDNNLSNTAVGEDRASSLRVSCR